MAGARGILVPNDATRRDEIAQAPEVARDLGEAVDRVLGVDHLPLPVAVEATA